MTCVRECDMRGCHEVADDCQYKAFYRASFMIKLDLCKKHLGEVKAAMKAEAQRHDDKLVSIFNSFSLGDRWEKRG